MSEQAIKLGLVQVLIQARVFESAISNEELANKIMDYLRRCAG